MVLLFASVIAHHLSFTIIHVLIHLIILILLACTSSILLHLLLVIHHVWIHHLHTILKLRILHISLHSHWIVLLIHTRHHTTHALVHSIALRISHLHWITHISILASKLLLGPTLRIAKHHWVCLSPTRFNSISLLLLKTTWSLILGHLLRTAFIVTVVTHNRRLNRLLWITTSSELWILLLRIIRIWLHSIRIWLLRHLTLLTFLTWLRHLRRLLLLYATVIHISIVKLALILFT